MPPEKVGTRLRSCVAGTSILGIALPDRLQTMVRQAIPAEVKFRMATTVDELATLSTSTCAPILLYSLPDTSTACAAERVSINEVLAIHNELRGRLRLLPAAALCVASHIDTRLVSSLRTLAHVQLVTVDAPAPHRALWSALEKLLATRISSSLLREIGDVDSLLIRRVTAVALCKAGGVVKVGDIARALHMHERTLRRKLREENCSLTSQELIAWARILIAAWHLRERQRPVVDIANALSFSAASNLHRLVKQYTGVSIRTLRKCDPVTVVASSFRSAVLRATADQP